MSMSKSLPNLKRCPFCGSEPKLIEVGENGFPQFNKFVIHCQNENCIVQPITRRFDDANKAINTWNRRVKE